MRRSRRGKHSGLEFGGSGEDSFVAVVVTKLTGALLFILLLTMVIMALLPKAVDSVAPSRDSAQSGAPSDREPLRIATPGSLPDAVAGRPYLVALAATGGHGTPRWSADGPLPEWLKLEESTGRLFGTPPEPTKESLALPISVGDGTEVVGRSIQLAILPAQSVAVAGVWWKPRWNAVAWQTWLEQGFGFLVLWLVHLLGMNLLAGLERQSIEESVLADGMETGQVAVHRRFSSYRLLIRLATLSATIALVVWLVMSARARALNPSEITGYRDPLEREGPTFSSSPPLLRPDIADPAPPHRTHYDWPSIFFGSNVAIVCANGANLNYQW